jgi:accessory gene regulator protein AgrB
MKRMIIIPILIIGFTILSFELRFFSLQGLSPFISNICTGILVLFFFLISYQVYNAPRSKWRWIQVVIFVGILLIGFGTSYFSLKNQMKNTVLRKYKYEKKEG